MEIFGAPITLQQGALEDSRSIVSYSPRCLLSIDIWLHGILRLSHGEILEIKNLVLKGLRPLYYETN